MCKQTFAASVGGDEGVESRQEVQMKKKMLATVCFLRGCLWEVYIVPFEEGFI
jgi:hypothetical protein